MFLAKPQDLPRSMRHERRCAVATTTMVLVALSIAKSCRGLPYVGSSLLWLCVLFYGFWPLHRVEQQQRAWSTLAICWPPAWFDWLYIGLHHAGLLLVSASTFWLTMHMGSHRWAALNWPHAAVFFIDQLFGIACLEEIFFRGYLHAALVPSSPQPSAAAARGMVAVNMYFALAHFCGEWQGIRLLTFFPGLWFSYVRHTTGSLCGSILLHASCNTFAYLLRQCLQS